MEVDNRLAGALVEARLCIDEVDAGNQHAILDEIFMTGLAIENFRVRRGKRRRHLLGCHCQIDHPEIKLGGLAQNFLQP